jgi:hypothetical protein
LLAQSPGDVTAGWLIAFSHAARAEILLKQGARDTAWRARPRRRSRQRPRPRGARRRVHDAVQAARPSGQAPRGPKAPPEAAGASATTAPELLITPRTHRSPWRAVRRLATTPP